MPNWERKQTDTLAEAIGKHLRNKPGLTEANARLKEIQVAVDAAANTVATTEGDLNFHRSQVCLICRSNKLYACDVPEGWSDNCALVYANASEFSPL
jgi:hypothetical protein